MLVEGARLGAYEVLGPLGTGGMGEVYRARDTRLARDVALKVLLDDLAHDPNRRRRLEREARVLAALNHPHICTIHDVGQQDGTDYLVMEYLEGETLRERLTRGAIAYPQGSDYALQLAQGLAAAHDRGLAHRDLKPENIFVTRHGHIKLLDFGLAKDVRPMYGSDVETRHHLTAQGALVGTVGYMSPEQLRGEPADECSDVFAFGLVLYEMLAGHRPFARNSTAETISALLNDEVAPLSSRGVSVPAGLERVLDRCLAKNPRARFHSARDLLSALSTAREGSDRAGPQGIPSLVVLPFVNLSSDPEDEWFSDGLTDELIADLSRVHDLRVVSSPSAFRLKGTDQSVRQIAGELKVSHVLVGRVRKSGRGVRLTAQLIEARDDRTVWADKYTGDLEQAFELQERVSQAIAAALEVQLRQPGRAPNAEAGEAYLKGRHFYRQATVDGMQKALKFFERATDLDPGYAPALTGVAYTLTWLTAAWTALPGRETMPKVRSHASRAIALDPLLPAAHVAQGAVATYADWNPQGAAASFEAALRLSPDDPEAHFWYAHSLMWLDTRFDEARRHAQRAAQLDPVNPWFQLWCSVAHYFSRDFDGAIDRARHLITLDPLWGFGHYFLGTSLATAGRLTEARASLERAIELDDRGVHTVSWLGCVHGLAGRQAKAAECLAELESHERRGSSVAAWKLPVYSGLGDGGHVMQCLEEAYDEGSASLVFHLTHPLVDCVRNDDRFTGLLRRMRLEHLVDYRPAPEWKPLAEWRQP